MSETISAIDLVRTVAISFAIEPLDGSVLTIVLRRAWGDARRDDPCEKTARDGMGAVARFIERVVPAWEDQMSAARESLREPASI